MYPKADLSYLEYTTVIAQCNYYGQDTNAFSILTHLNDVFFHMDGNLHHLPFTTSDTLYDVFSKIDYYGLDITSEILLNHIQYNILSTPMEMLVVPIHMNLYSYRSVIKQLIKREDLSERHKQTFHGTLPEDHISTSVALHVLDN